MSSRPISKKQVITDGDMSSNITSEVTIITNQSIIGYQLSWSGSSPVGTAAVEVSNDYAVNGEGVVTNAGTWSTATSASISGNTGNGYFNMSNQSSYAIRLKYTRTSGSGTLQVNQTGKVA